MHEGNEENGVPHPSEGIGDESNFARVVHCDESQFIRNTIREVWYAKDQEPAPPYVIEVNGRNDGKPFPFPWRENGPTAIRISEHKGKDGEWRIRCAFDPKELWNWLCGPTIRYSTIECKAGLFAFVQGGAAKGEESMMSKLLKSCLESIEKGIPVAVQLPSAEPRHYGYSEVTAGGIHVFFSGADDSPVARVTTVSGITAALYHPSSLIMFCVQHSMLFPIKLAHSSTVTKDSPLFNLCCLLATNE